MPADWQLQLMNGIHRTILKATGGRVGWSVAGMQVLELTTKGAKSGHPRTVMLTSPVQEGHAVVIVASRGGDDHHPGWYHNLRANPEVTASLAGAPKTTMRARVANPDERARLWPQVTSRVGQYANYQRKTSREIPLVILEPVGGTTPA